jgi:prophage maintenance system killer protein
LLTKKIIVEINKGILKEWNEKNPTNKETIAVNVDRLDEVLGMVQKHDEPIVQAAYLLAGISWAQPFSGGNKRTGIVCADTLLRINGLMLVIEAESDISYLQNLLYEIQESRSELDDMTLAKIILYVTKRIKKHGSA